MVVKLESGGGTKKLVFVKKCRKKIWVLVALFPMKHNEIEILNTSMTFLIKETPFELFHHSFFKISFTIQNDPEQLFFLN